MSTKREVEKQFKRIERQMDRLEISLTPELMRRVDHIVELLGSLAGGVMRESPSSEGINRGVS